MTSQWIGTEDKICNCYNVLYVMSTILVNSSVECKQQWVNTRGIMFLPQGARAVGHYRVCKRNNWTGFERIFIWFSVMLHFLYKMSLIKWIWLFPTSTWALYGLVHLNARSAIHWKRAVEGTAGFSPILCRPTCREIIYIKIPSEMEVAPRYKLLKLLARLTLLTVLTLLRLLYTAKTLACKPIYVVRKS